jgi:acyl-CoA reductase-like NAD-dependent aldehyde dehydrogenase
LLPLALDNDILHIVQRGASDSDLPTGAIRVFQESTQETVKPTDLISPSASRTIAIVDRTADLDSAAKALVAARFGFGGKSPYAPDVTLVNDYMMGEFLKAVVQHSLHYQAQPNATSDTPKVYKRMPAHDSGLLGELQKTEDSRLICSDRRGTVVELTQR